MTTPFDPDSDVDSDHGFESFERKRMPRCLGENEVSLSATNILISKQLSRRMPRVERVVLMFNARKREIGVRPAKDRERGYKISGRSISSRLFCTHFGITERGRLPARIENGTLRISLSAPDKGENL